MKKYNKPQFLTKKEFFNVYGLSLITNKHYHHKCLEILLPIAKKYCTITSYVIHKELSHLFEWTTYCGSENANKILDKYKITNWKSSRKKLSLEICEELFLIKGWDREYGGKAWAKITTVCIELKKELENPDFLKLIILLDRLNQLEHNNDLYLHDFVLFPLRIALNDKFKNSEEKILEECSIKVKLLYKKAMHEKQSIIAYFHNQGKSC